MYYHINQIISDPYFLYNGFQKNIFCVAFCFLIDIYVKKCNNRVTKNRKGGFNMNYDYVNYATSNYARGLDTTSSAISSNASDVVIAAMAGFLGLIILIASVITVIQIIGMWKVFTKAGEKGWKAIIPFYNIAILYKISGMSPYLVFVYIGLFIPIINIFASTALAIITLYQKVNLMNAFRASTGLTVAMIMVPFITYLILGFGKSEYFGLDEEKTTTVEAE